MKKILSFIFILFIPFIVHAEDIEIKSVELIEKTGNVVINKEPTFSGIKLNFDLEFTNVEDSVKYKVIVKNNSEEDYNIEDQVKYGKDEYVKYDIVVNDKEYYIKAGQEKSLTITVSYDKEIPNEGFDDGEYTEQGSISIFFDNEKNPNTSTSLTSVIFILTASAVAIILLALKHRKGAVATMLITLAIVPAVSLATKKVSFDIDSKIHITDRCYILDTTIGSFEEGRETKSICVKFTANKYIMEDYYFIQTSQEGANTDKLVIDVFREHLTDKSYVRVYDLEDNLLIEVTLKDFPRPLLNVPYAAYHDGSRVIKTIGDYSRDEVRLELSEDLLDYDLFDIAYIMYSADPAPIKIKGPWIENEESIEKIFYLESFSTQQQGLKGFERDKKDSHLYHAIWGVIEK